MIDVSPVQNILFTFSVAMARMVAAFAIVPFLNPNIIQGVVRNSIILSITLMVYPVVAPTVPETIPSIPLLAVILLKEVIIGILIGFMVSIVFWAIQGIGFFIDNQRGTAMASVFDPLAGTQNTPFGVLLLQLMTVLFFTSGGFLILLSGLFESYRIWPVFSFYPTINGEFALFFLQQADEYMRLTILYAAPVIIALFVAEFGLGLVNRFAPQLNVFFLSMPIKSGIALFILVLYIPFLIHFYHGHFEDIGTIFKLLRGIIGG